MDVSQLLSDQVRSSSDETQQHQPRQPHPYPTRSTHPAIIPQPNGILPHDLSDVPIYQPTLPPISTGYSQARLPPKVVNFQLMLSHIPQHRARLPLRVHIQPHDTTDSIITTVKNFYGLYEGEGVSFEDGNGITLITRYENIDNNSTVFVRITSEEPVEAGPPVLPNGPLSPQKPHLDEPFQILPQQPLSRPSSRAMKNRDASPQSVISRRSISARPPQGLKIRNPFDDLDAAHGLSDSDGGSVSVSSSRKTKSDHLASAEISLDNILEGGRRKKAKFESSELPLFAPPQQPMTASMSSLSPQRRFQNGLARSPLQFNNQYTFSYTPAALLSPQSFGNNEFLTPKTGNGNVNGSVNGNGTAHLNIQAPVQSQRLRARASSGHGPSRLSGGSSSGILPTPDPTIGSAISDEDVAWHLMRLGDPANQSHGRTSNSTADDALSGKAEVASSVEGSSDDARLDSSLEKPRRHASHARKRQKVSSAMLPRYSSEESSGEESEDRLEGQSTTNGSALGHPKLNTSKAAKHRNANPTGRGQGKMKQKSSANKVPTHHSSSKDSSSRKASNASASQPQELAEDEEDLSAKPRCQRCRKSKKGCDRQRPCQRCKDAGIGIEGCISEDEGNGRKGRYGRHMGVSVKKSPAEAGFAFDYPPFPEPIHTQEPVPLGPELPMDSLKKRKR